MGRDEVRFATTFLDGRKIDHYLEDTGPSFHFIECWDLLCILLRFNCATVKNKNLTEICMDDYEVTQAGVGSSFSVPEKSTTDEDNDIKAEQKVGNLKKRPLGRQAAKHLSAEDAARY